MVIPGNSRTGRILSLIHIFELDDWEADDLIAAYAKAAVEAGGEAVIVSSDKDLMQLIRPGVTMLDPMKNVPIGEAEVAAKFGVTPDKVIEVQALIGDSVDKMCIRDRCVAAMRW